ncbi:MAG: aminoacyl-tRNA hydrolase [Thermovenabulum sp.]|uniref:aminoacyl-tRNA hydrolase n=1 Tax=Thermovenabulum sp. TaxID=3100335 RepID=UPI003C7E2F1B
MYLIAGLGNPGKQYENTRHNIGFIVVDFIAKELGTNIDKIKFKALYNDIFYKNEKLILLKPMTYMNLSGESVKEAVSFYKLPLSNLIVIYDDMDLPLGKIRIKRSGSSGGHKGVESIIYQLASEDFLRIRIGIGKPKPGQDTISHVIGTFDAEEENKVKEIIKIAARATFCIIEEGIERAMNLYNGIKL